MVYVCLSVDLKLIPKKRLRAIILLSYATVWFLIVNYSKLNMLNRIISWTDIKQFIV